jgi:hypothetical protein
MARLLPSFTALITYSPTVPNESLSLAYGPLEAALLKIAEPIAISNSTLLSLLETDMPQVDIDQLPENQGDEISRQCGLAIYVCLSVLLYGHTRWTSLLHAPLHDAT